MPLLIPAVAAEKHWSKTESGTVLSSFFWGYTLTQVLGGYFSDKYGGQRVIYSAALVWAVITFLMPELIALPGSVSATWTISFVVVVRIINGAAQGVHFPSMMSVVSQNLNATERTSFFSLLTSGGAIGTLLTGTLGSFLLDYFGWATAFRIFGLIAITWALFLRQFTLEQEKGRIVNLSDRLMLANGEYTENVPWLKLLTRSSVWACILSHACQNNCFFVLLSWMPTYFHDNFPHAKGWVANMIPWMVLPFCTLFAKLLTDRLIKKGWSLTATRKIIQSICFGAEILALLFMMHVKTFGAALTCMTVIIGGSGFHNAGVTVNPQDLAPKHSGSVFGLMNTVGAIPGFLGVYLAGHILELTQSWAAVFSTSIAVNVAGWIIFVIFGSAEAVA